MSINYLFLIYLLKKKNIYPTSSGYEGEEKQSAKLLFLGNHKYYNISKDTSCLVFFFFDK